MQRIKKYLLKESFSFYTLMCKYGAYVSMILPAGLLGVLMDHYYLPHKLIWMVLGTIFIPLTVLIWWKVSKHFRDKHNIPIWFWQDEKKG